MLSRLLLPPRGCCFISLTSGRHNSWTELGENRKWHLLVKRENSLTGGRRPNIPWVTSAWQRHSTVLVGCEEVQGNLRWHWTHISASCFLSPGSWEIMSVQRWSCSCTMPPSPPTWIPALASLLLSYLVPHRYFLIYFERVTRKIWSDTSLFKVTSHCMVQLLVLSNFTSPLPFPSPIFLPSPSLSSTYTNVFTVAYIDPSSLHYLFFMLVTLSHLTDSPPQASELSLITTLQGHPT